jgi:hypothetical protein
MSDNNSNDVKIEAIKSLERIQGFDPESLVQHSRLGEAAFHSAVKPASKIIELFKQVPVEALGFFPDSELNTIKTLSDSLFNIFDEIMAFDINVGDNKARRDAIIQKLSSQYQSVFSKIFPFVSYSVARTVDFNQLDQQGRAAVQSLKDQTESILSDMKEQQDAAERMLQNVRQTAAEQGVSQKAIYFKDEADKHAAESLVWRTRTVWISVVIIAYGILALFAHKWAWLAPQSIYENVQFSLSKILIFFIFTYLLFLCSRNFMSNRHNEIVNRHRQNALLTYQALVDAGANPSSRDIVLGYAASAIYGLHDTGYTKPSEGGNTVSSIIEMMPKSTLSSGS